ncbi:AAA family ATPase [Bradyrhizobium sp. WSM2793]|uniref:AAA family ATPase n=1 Tax=Bradyrhizobium sp. WSM2793 TaxID=1038866 RepID=UPI0003A03B81|nr:AAA family ATPase [Bradyrhizobium sp. WSM2793]
MRLRRLDLTRYGKFTDHSIDFGERPTDQPDLHVIYGPNEAGKSTAFTAFLDLLFGIATQSPFGFLHPYSTMRIGGALEFDGEKREFARIKRPQNSLLDADERPIPESAIRGELGGIERDAYRTMFSLDDESLEKGGESILASKGDLGQLLFSASAGLSHLSQKLIDVRAEADGFYKFRGRSGVLVDLKARLAELKAKREKLDILASDHARLVETRDRSKTHYDEAVTERTCARGRIDQIQRHLAALPRLVALRRIHERLAPLADVPDAPPGWANEVPGLQKEEIELGVQTNATADEVERLADEIAAIAVDEAALRLAERVERLAELRARHVTAEKDIPERRLQLREIDRVISTILQRVEREEETEPRRLVLTAATIGRLRELIEARSGIDASIQNAAAELAEACRRLDEIGERAPETGGDPQTARERDRSMAELATTVEALRSADHHVRYRLAERARVTAFEVLSDRLSVLRPWQGTADDLVAMPCPGPDTVQRWKAAHGNAEAVLVRHQSEIERLTTQLCRLEAEWAGLASVTGVVTDQEAAEIRRRREQAWAAHRHALDLASADAFEAAMRHDDIISAGRFSHMSELAKLHQSGQALAVTRADLERAVELKDGAAAALGRLDVEVAEAVRTMTTSFVSVPSLPELEDWLVRRERALEAREAVRNAEQDLRAAQSDAGAATQRLRAALGRAGRLQESDADFDALVASAQAALDREAELCRLRAELDGRQRDVDLRERAAELAESDERIWAKAWSATCRGSWLGEAPEVPAIGGPRGPRCDRRSCAGAREASRSRRPHRKFGEGPGDVS